ncbi:MAG: hypothetical protein A2511_13545 [Deltaproteobacteria bacterium RIFOXYD12_FULL_50_9]|nr:MAG: hypothetical protein A2511_13545 [Deltaproteobacteria bacterium RIFOXYD12_FULL_50_9]
MNCHFFAIFCLRGGFSHFGIGPRQSNLQSNLPLDNAAPWGNIKNVLCQWHENLQRLPLSPPGESAVFLCLA